MGGTVPSIAAKTTSPSETTAAKKPKQLDTAGARQAGYAAQRTTAASIQHRMLQDSVGGRHLYNGEGYSCMRIGAP